MPARSTLPARNPSLGIRPRRQRSQIPSLERGAPRVRIRTNAVRRRATHWRPHRHPTRRPGRPRAAPTERARRASRTSPRIVGRPSPRRARVMRRMLSNCVPATTCSYSASGPLTLTHHGLSHSRNANTSGPHAESHARTGTEVGWQRALIRNVRYSRLLPTSCYRKATGMMTVVKGTIVDYVTVGAVPVPEGDRPDLHVVRKA
jgi:hypothetical protein